MKATPWRCILAVPNVIGLPKFDSDVKAWFASVKEAAEEAAVGLAKVAFNQILYTSPQFSGDFVANTRLSIGTPDTSFTPAAVSPSEKISLTAFSVGSEPAINYAKSGNAEKLMGFKLGQKIFISNSASHDEAYAHKVEAGTIHLRQVNQGASHVFGRAVTFTTSRYGNLGKSKLAALRRFGV